MEHPPCLCQDCGNPNGERELVKEDDEQKHDGQENQRERKFSKFQRMSTQEAYDSAKLVPRQSIWREEEKLAIFLCKKLVRSPRSTGEIARVYNSMAERTSVLREKSDKQIGFKLKDM